METGDVITADFHMHLPEFSARHLTFTPAFAEGTVNEFAVCDIVEDAIQIPIEPGKTTVQGLLGIPCRTVRFSHARGFDRQLLHKPSRER